MPRISIAMATFNGHRFLREQLKSLLAQSLPPFELVIRDDGSTDETLPIIEDFARTAPFPVRLYQNDIRLGYRANFMACTSLCNGDLIAFCDQDDIWLPHKLARQAASFDNPAILLSSHDVELIDEHGEKLRRTFRHENLKPRMAFWSAPPFAFSMGFTLMLRRALLDLNGLWPMSLDNNDVDEPMAHEQWFYFLALIFGFAEHSTQCLAHYRQHSSNASGQRKRTSKAARLSQLFDSRTEEYARLSSAALNRCALVDAFATEPSAQRLAADGDLPQRLEQARRAFERLFRASSRRRALYENRSISGGLSLYTRSFVTGDYRPGNPWYFSLKGAARDFAALAMHR